MKEVKTTTEKILEAYRIIGVAKYTKLSDEDKIKVWKIARAMKPIANKFDDDSKDAAEKLKPEGDFDERLQKAQQFEVLRRGDVDDIKKSPMGVAEYSEFMGEFQAYRKLVDNAIKEYATKEVQIAFEPLSEETFGNLMASNDWNMEQACVLSDIICE